MEGEQRFLGLGGRRPRVAITVFVATMITLLFASLAVRKMGYGWADWVMFAWLPIGMGLALLFKQIGWTNPQPGSAANSPMPPVSLALKIVCVALGLLAFAAIYWVSQSTGAVQRPGVGQIIATAVFGVVVLAFTVLSFQQALLCSKVIGLLHGTDLEKELRCRTAPKVRWYAVHSPTGYDALSAELWQEILKVPNPPEAVASIIGEMRSVWRIQMITLWIGATAMAAFVAIFIAGHFWS